MAWERSSKRAGSHRAVVLRRGLRVRFLEGRGELARVPWAGRRASVGQLIGSRNAFWRPDARWRASTGDLSCRARAVEGIEIRHRRVPSTAQAAQEADDRSRTRT